MKHETKISCDIRPFSLDMKKHGFLKLSRNQASALFNGSEKGRKTALLLLCIQLHLYFRKGKIHLRNATYTCNPGQWITSYSELAEYTGIDRKCVKTLLQEMIDWRWLSVEKLGNYQCITYRVTDLSAAPIMEQPLQTSDPD